MELQDGLQKLRDRGLGLAVISYDHREVLAAFARQHGIGFPLLSDAGSETIKRYGILNTVVAEALGPTAGDPAVLEDAQRFISAVNPRPKPAMLGIPFPGTFIVDRQGRVTSRFFEEFYVERNTVSSILKRVGGDGAAVQATRISTAHLELTTYPSDESVAPGNRFSLVLDIAPKPGMHVYAPGAKGYRIVSVTIAPQAFVRTPPVTYPPSEIYHFKPLDERVPVYQKPFTLLQEVVIEGDQKARAALRETSGLRLTGTLEYQACDDTICFNPVVVPLSWNVNLRPLILPRPQG